MSSHGIMLKSLKFHDFVIFRRFFINNNIKFTIFQYPQNYSSTHKSLYQSAEVAKC